MPIFKNPSFLKWITNSYNKLAVVPGVARDILVRDIQKPNLYLALPNLTHTHTMGVRGKGINIIPPDKFQRTF
jgi:hypothetical protein